MIRGFLLAVTAICAVGPAAAQAGPTCDAVAKAMLRVGEQPAVRQQTIEGTPPRVSTEAISHPDAMYLREGGEGPWRKVAIDQARRRQMAEQGLTLAPLSDCTGPASRVHDGTTVQVFGFRQPDLLKPGSFTSSELWVGADGLPRRLVMSATSYQTMEYGAVPAPTDLIPTRPPRGKPAR